MNIKKTSRDFEVGLREKYEKHFLLVKMHEGRIIKRSERLNHIMVLEKEKINCLERELAEKRKKLVRIMSLQKRCKKVLPKRRRGSRKKRSFLKMLKNSAIMRKLFGISKDEEAGIRLKIFLEYWEKEETRRNQ